MILISKFAYKLIWFFFILKIRQHGHEGFVVDLAKEIADKLGRRFKLKVHPEGIYGSYDPIMQKWNGLIGDVISGKLDFAIADLTVTEERKQAVDFSTTFLHTGIAIVITQTTREALPFNNVHEMVDNPQIEYGAVTKGATVRYIKEHSNTCSVFRKMSEYWEQHPDNLVSYVHEGLLKTKDQPRHYAFLMEAFALELWKNEYPNIIQVGDVIIPREFAVVIRKGEICHF